MSRAFLPKMLLFWFSLLFLSAVSAHSPAFPGQLHWNWRSSLSV
jgi:hypothetical protein